MIVATVKSYIQFSGDQGSELIFSSGSLVDSPAMEQLTQALVGDNTYDSPAFDGFVVHGVIIIPPTPNVNEFLLKGDIGDIGLHISASQATVIHFGADFIGSLILENIGAENIIGLRLVWF